MNRLLPLPIYTFIKIVIRNGGISLKGLFKIPFWLLKTVIFEPLRWLELTYNKKLKQHRITKDPVFILGFYRSGTSYLHEFLTQDDRFGYHTNFQMIFPEIMLISEKWLSPLFNFIFGVFSLTDPVHRGRLSLEFPGEEDGAMTTYINPRGAAWGYFFPAKMKEYFQKYVLFENISKRIFNEWKQDYLFLLKKISFANNGKPLVLKSPPNTARIKLILSTFPNAKFVLIHRDPFEVFASNKRFLKITNWLYAIGTTKSMDVNKTIAYTYAKTMQRYILEKHLIPEGQLIEIPYTDFIENPTRSIKKLYETLELHEFAYCEKEMIEFEKRQESFKRLRHKLSAEEKNLVSKELELIIKHWDY